MPNQGGHKEQQQGRPGQPGQKKEEIKKAAPGQQDQEKRAQQDERGGKR